MAKACVKIKACNMGSSSAHNRRSTQYMAWIKPEDVYIREDLTRENKEWVADWLGDMSLDDYLEKVLKPLVKEKTNRSMQMKERVVKDEKTGRMKKTNGCSALREGVVLIKESTTMDDLHRFTDAVQAKFGITPMQIFIHRDEGHYEKGTNEWKPNLHAHIVWDWINHANGKTWKLDGDDMSAVQKMAADILGMEYGEPKAKTGAKHLERNDYIVAKQKREAEEARREKESIENEIEDLSERRQQKQNELDKEAGTAIVQKFASFVGKGELAEEKKKRKQAEKALAAERKAHTKTKSDAEAQKQRLETEKSNLLQAATIEKGEAVKTAIANQKRIDTTALNKVKKELQETKDSHASAIEQLKRDHEQALGNNSAQTKRENTNLKNEIAQLKCDLHNAQVMYKGVRSTLVEIGKFLMAAMEIFAKAVRSLMDFMGEKCKMNGRSILHNEEALNIKTAIACCSLTDQNGSNLNQMDIAHAIAVTAAELGGYPAHVEHWGATEAIDVAKGRYDRRIAQAYGSSQSR